jgi:hypothetical protein
MFLDALITYIYTYIHTYIHKYIQSIPKRCIHIIIRNINLVHIIYTCVFYLVSRQQNNTVYTFVLFKTVHYKSNIVICHRIGIMIRNIVCAV